VAQADPSDEASTGSPGGAASLGEVPVDSGSATDSPEPLKLSGWMPGSDEADDLKRRCARLDSVDAENLKEARREMKAGGFSEAFALLDGLRERYPSDVLLLADLGWCRFAQEPDNIRSVDKALEWVDLGLAFAPNNKRALTVKARILCHAGRGEAAHEALRRVAPLLPDSAWIRSELAQRNESAEELVKAKGIRRFWGQRK
ncbi:MAG: hypothetical protein VX498_00790, partial [Myxococcota bacterium]|nr:hypothetical protein [Myxococcota bacterium]